jgi:hypothetical protein
MEHQFDIFIIHIIARIIMYIFIIRIIACAITWHMDSGLFWMPSAEDHARNWLTVEMRISLLIKLN